jgi:hypothetical protein
MTNSDNSGDSALISALIDGISVTNFGDSLLNALIPPHRLG